SCASASATASTTPRSSSPWWWPWPTRRPTARRGTRRRDRVPGGPRARRPPVRRARMAVPGPACPDRAPGPPCHVVGRPPGLPPSSDTTEGPHVTNLSINDLFSVEGKVVVVTGGSRGIGEMIAAGFLANGAKVYISSRKAEVCDATAERLSAEYGGTCVSIPANLAELEGIDGFVAGLREHESAVHVLVNNAGASWGAPMDEFPEIGWD